MDYHRYPPKNRAHSADDKRPGNEPATRNLTNPEERRAARERIEQQQRDAAAFDDWIEGRHRTHKIRRRRHELQDETQPAAASVPPPVSPPKDVTAKTRHKAARHVKVLAAETSLSSVNPTANETEEKGAHRRERWERQRKKTAPASKRARTPFWRMAQRVAIFLLIVGAGELTLAALTTPRFAVQDVEITGLNITPPESVESVTRALVGQNWIRVRTQSAAQKIESLPTVKSARVERVLGLPPLHLALHVTERTPFARVGAGNSWWVVDESGVPFRAAVAGDNDLHAVTSPALKPETIVLGRALPAESWQPFAQLANAIADDEKLGGQWKLRRTYLDRFGLASLRLQGGENDELLVRLGAGRWPEKLQRARQALDYLAATGRRAQALNLVSYEMPTWTPRRVADTEDSTTNDSDATSDEADEKAVTNGNAAT